MYLPLNDGSHKKYLFRISAQYLCLFTVAFPLLAFITCVIITMYKDFVNANRTHCDVPNIFPSISASIGNYEPQRSIWRIAIYSHAPFRFFIIYLRWDYYCDVISRSCRLLVKLAVILNIFENMALIGLSHWTSTENYPYHEFCFKTFMTSSIIYMLLCSILLKTYRRKSHMTKNEKFSLSVKWKMCCINIISFAMAGYFFIRHNRLCEPYVYSMFSFCEYLVVTTNIGFHITTVFDLKIHYILLTRRGISID